MSTILLPYGKQHLSVNIPEERLGQVLTSDLNEYRPAMDEIGLVRRALNVPIGSLPLSHMARGKKNIVILASDHTRPVPSKIILPLMLEEIREGNPDAEITILIATGCHRNSTKEELRGKLGDDILANERIVFHDCDDPSIVDVGRLPSGGRLLLNKMALEADLLCSEGFIEPHFFAGFSGGRKSVLPGVCGRETVLSNHCSAFVANCKARSGVLEGNPIHRDMLYAAKKARLQFIVNVVINAEKEVIYAVAGDCEAAHAAGVAFLYQRCQIHASPADIVITTNGGYPLDQNIYQAVKGMTTAESVVRPGGVIIMVAQSIDGHGAETFYETVKNASNLSELYQEIMNTPPEKTAVDQWQSQILSRILQYAHVIYVSDAPDQLVREMHMQPAHTVEEAISAADIILGNHLSKITVIPDGVSVITA